MYYSYREWRSQKNIEKVISCRNTDTNMLEISFPENIIYYNNLFAYR